ncbi:phosphatidylinositol mannoside acyltransferase [Luteimicrobium sp. NPDC057192]|uniref:phosphatidylinositol mannoside acyltransferase n=1 Tax=Luteimicrobium sp. NPDC057192 TaxID=3346042 RepID=UPI00362F1C7A
MTRRMGIDVGKLYATAWRLAPKVPEPVLRGAFTAIADTSWALRKGGVDQLERNLERVAPGLDRRDLRRLSRAGMRSYMRYFREAFTLSGATPEQIQARMRVANREAVQPYFDEGRSVLLALGHLGNWDLAGAWGTRNLAPVLTVAERLEPPSLFEEFVSFRESLGMKILAFGDDGVFRSLVRGTQEGGRLVPLLADRDLSSQGVEVDMFGERVRVAAGPAALSVMTGAPLLGTSLTYERLEGERRRAAGTPWGIVATFGPPIETDPALTRRERIAQGTQQWVDFVASEIRRKPEDWHMLQKLFVADLDADRYARTVAKEKATAAEGGTR